MDRYAGGDDAALDELYRHAAPRVRAFLYRVCLDPALADDLTQEAFLRICRARGAFAAGAPALPWILAIARNAFRDHVRREQVRRGHRDDVARQRDSAAAGPAADACDAAVIARQTLDVIRTALGTLPVRQREALVLVRIEGLPLADAAQVLGATEGAVKLLVFRAQEALRAIVTRTNRNASASSGLR